MNWKAIKLETQMRSGSHFLMDALSRCYHLAPAAIKRDGTFYIADSKRLSKGLYEEGDPHYATDSGIILQYHFYHSVIEDERLKNADTIYLFSFPFDTYFSEGLIYSSDLYTVAPTTRHRNFPNYVLKYNSSEWYSIEELIYQNAQWLIALKDYSDKFIIRYEDLFLNELLTLQRVETFLGPFMEPFPKVIKNPHRMYWTQDYKRRMDEQAFLKIKEIFEGSLEFFWPERAPFVYI